MKRVYVAISALVLIAGCYFFPYSEDIVSEKFNASTLQQDFTVFRTVLEKAHPGLYTYAGKNEMAAAIPTFIYPKTITTPFSGAVIFFLFRLFM